MNEVFDAIGKVFVPLATLTGFAGVVVAWRRHLAQTQADTERRITESFAKAIEQLGSNKLEVRLGGIYTLERIALESEREYWPIIETLTAFVRERAPWPPQARVTNRNTGLPVEQLAKASKASLNVRPATDIAAVLTVLGRRSEKQRMQDKARLDLSRTDLRGAYLGGAHLERADFREARLEGADLIAHFEDAWFKAAHLQGADLSGARLERANFAKAGLQGAILTAARLERVNLREARLDGAHMEGAKLQDARNLTQEQLDAADGDDQTVLPAGLTRPAHWSKSEGMEKGD